jgi:hypothetical protein
MKELDSKSFWPILAVLVFMAVSYGETLIGFFPGLTVIDLAGFYLAAFVTGVLAGLHLARRRRAEARAGDKLNGIDDHH